MVQRLDTQATVQRLDTQATVQRLDTQAMVQRLDTQAESVKDRPINLAVPTQQAACCSQCLGCC